MAQPLRIKQRPTEIEHVQAPLKGLSLSSKLATSDPLTAPILDNWVVEEDRITCRPGYKTLTTLPTGRGVQCLIPFYGQPNELAAASDNKLYRLNGTLIKDGFTSDDWHWTSFSNLSDTDFTVMVNGRDGVWSWDGAVMVKEAVTAPAGATYINPDQFQVVMSHMNRLWFADNTTLAVYYLPIQQKSGELKELPLNAIFRRGGSIRAIYTWTVDGGMGLDDQIVFFSTNGEAAIYGGVDPDTDLTLTGVYRFDSPMSKHSVIQYGGDLYCLISTGLVPMSTLMRSEEQNLGKSDKAVVTAFEAISVAQRSSPGWSVLMDNSTGRMICNLPLGPVNSFRQLVRKMPNSIWSQWSSLPARCWGWVDNRLFFGCDMGRIYEMSPLYLNDNSLAIKVDVQAAWRQFKTPARKHFKMIRPYVITDGIPRLLTDVRTDYDSNPPINQPDVTTAPPGSLWDVSDWDEATWAGATLQQSDWTGVAGLGVVGAPRLTALIRDCTFSLAGWDVLYERGAVL